MQAVGQQNVPSETCWQTGMQTDRLKVTQQQVRMNKLLSWQQSGQASSVHVSAVSSYTNTATKPLMTFPDLSKMCMSRCVAPTAIVLPEIATDWHQWINEATLPFAGLAYIDDHSSFSRPSPVCPRYPTDCPWFLLRPPAWSDGTSCHQPLQTGSE